MYLSCLKGKNVRRIKTFCIHPVSGLNVIFGSNGSGKTTILEAIYLLGVGRSFRTHQIGSVISFGESHLNVIGQLEPLHRGSLTIGLDKSPGHTRIRADGELMRSISQVAKLFPLLFFGPDSIRLLSEGGEARRRWLDWMVFHVEPNFQAVVKRYYRALKQRNSFLKDPHGFCDFRIWDKELADSGEILAKFRLDHFCAIKQLVLEKIQRLMPFEVQIDYLRGWPKDVALLDSLDKTRFKDGHLGYTSAGPHRGDLRFSINRRAAKEILSRGEIKLLVATMQLAQAAYCIQAGETKPVILIDEMASELDEKNRLSFLTELQECGVQIFITAVERTLFPAESANKMFHVEQGQIQDVV